MVGIYPPKYPALRLSRYPHAAKLLIVGSVLAGAETSLDWVGTSQVTHIKQKVNITLEKFRIKYINIVFIRAFVLAYKGIVGMLI